LLQEDAATDAMHITCPAVLINWSQLIAACEFITLTIVLCLILLAGAIAAGYIFTYYTSAYHRPLEIVKEKKLGGNTEAKIH